MHTHANKANLAFRSPVGEEVWQVPHTHTQRPIPCTCPVQLSFIQAEGDSPVTLQGFNSELCAKAAAAQ